MVNYKYVILNANMTQFMIFKSKKKEIVSWWKSDSKWSSSQEVNYTKFLGLYFDENLSWKYHISHVTMKMSKMTGILAKTRPYLPLKLTLQLLYMTMIYPYVNECYFTEVIPLNNNNNNNNELYLHDHTSTYSNAKAMFRNQNNTGQLRYFDDNLSQASKQAEIYFMNCIFIR